MARSAATEAESRPGAAGRAGAAPPPVGSRLGIGLALFAVYVIWGSTYLAIRIGLEGFPPFLMAGIRFALAGGAMFVVLRARGTPAPRRAQWGAAALVGLLLLVGGNGLVSVAEQSVASGLAALVVATTPIWAALLAGIWGQWPARGEWLGLALGIGGVALLSLGGDLRANPWGAGVVLLAAGSWALGSVWSRHLPLPPGPIASAVEMLAAGGILLLASVLTGERMPGVPGPRPLLALAYLVVFGSIVAFSAYGYLLARVRPTLATSYAYVNPLVAVALGAGILGEPITPVTGLAMAVILAGVVLVTRSRARG